MLPDSIVGDLYRVTPIDLKENVIFYQQHPLLDLKAELSDLSICPESTLHVGARGLKYYTIRRVFRSFGNGDCEEFMVVDHHGKQMISMIFYLDEMMQVEKVVIDEIPLGFSGNIIESQYTESGIVTLDMDNIEKSFLRSGNIIEPLHVMEIQKGYQGLLPVNYDMIVGVLERGGHLLP
jgi:hypothetical protein